MARYRLQIQDGLYRIWKDTVTTFNTKEQLDNFIGEYQVDYEYRVGYYFKHWNNPVARFVWNSGKKIGQEVKV